MQRVLLAFACLLVAATVVSATSTPRSQAKITSLPNINFTPSFDQYSGYITINNSTNKNLFYWFVTSTSGNPTNDPVILWLQGGPGCSGLGGGLLEENGPYYPYILNANNQSVGLTSAFYTWNKVANMIYIESPCGVGFSYSDNPADYHTNDNTTAMDNFLFLTYFFQMYPEWANNEFWITGESYGGVYIPTLAYVIMTNNTNPTLQNNLKKGGLMLGNPVTGCDGTNFDGEADILDLDTTVNNFYWHAMVSRRNYDTWNNLQCNTSKPPSLIKCLQLYATITKGVGRMDQPLRSQAATLRRRPAAPTGISQMVQPLFSSAPVEAKANDDGVINPDCLYYSFCEGNATLQFNTAILPDCFNIDDQVSAYLNNPAVQSAIHARPTKWEMCGGVIYNRNVQSLIPYLEALFQLAPTMRILYYSGDIDIATVPFPGTQRCLETMQRPILKEWRPWIVNKEIAGYVEVYDTYTYATIKGAGHEAPAYQPAGAYLLFTSFLKNQTLPAPPA